jgi:type I restriction enzyme S subunit
MEGWKESTIGDVFETVTGGTPPKSKKELYGDFMPFIKPPELTDGTIDCSADGLSEAGAKQARVLPPKSVLVSCIGILGKLGMNTAPAACNQQINAIKPNGDVAYPEFVFYYCLSPRFSKQLCDLAAGTTVPIVNKSKFNSIAIPLPSLPEQERIVAILDEAFAAIATATANAEKNLANAGELFESELDEALRGSSNEWIEKDLGDVCEIASKLVDPRNPEHIDLPHVGAGNMISKTGEIVGVQTAREEKLKSGKFVFDDRMVLYSKIRPYLMKVSRPSFKGLCSADVYPLLPIAPDDSRDFLFYILLSEHFTSYAVKGSARAGMPKVNREHLFAYRRPLPPPDQQRHIAARLDAFADETRRLVSIHQLKLGALSRLKQSILHKAFTGELTADPKATDRTLSEAGL